MSLLDIDPKEAARLEIEKVIQTWRAMREARLEAAKIMDSLEMEEKRYKEWIIQTMDSQKLEAIVVGGRITGIKEDDVWVADDRAEFLNYVLDNRCPELLQFRLSPAAINERVEELDGAIPEGLGTVKVNKLFDRKV